MFVLIFSTTLVWNTLHSEKNWVWYDQNCILVFISSTMSDFNETWIFSTDFQKNIQISNFMSIRPVGAKLFHVDREADMTKLTVAFCNSANVPKQLFIQ
jgi:hypothetical protein